MAYQSSPLASFATLAAIIIGGVVHRCLAGRSIVVRWGGSTVAAASFAAAISIIPALSSYGDGRSDQAKFEQELTSKYPAMRLIADNEPQLWDLVRGEMYETVKASGGVVSPATKPRFDALATQISTRLNSVAYTAADAPLVDWLSAEVAVTSSLQASDAKACSDRLKGAYIDFTKLSQRDKELVLRSQDKLQLAYLDGVKSHVAYPDHVRGDGLMIRALTHPEAPFTKSELDAIQNVDKLSDTNFCSLNNKLLTNVLRLSMSDAASTLRFMNAPQPPTPSSK